MLLHRLALWLLPLGFLGIFFFLPLGRILQQGLDFRALRAADIQLATQTLGFTVYQALLSTLLTFAVGIPAAALFANYEFRGRALLRALTAVPFMLPTVVVAASFNAFLGPRGWLNLSLMRLFGLPAPPVAITGTLGAILLAHVFYNATIVIRLVGGALTSLDPRVRAAATSLGAAPWQVQTRIVLPLLRPALLAAALLVFLFDFSSFGVVLLLGSPRFPTLEVAVYVQAVQLLNLPVAASLALIQLLCTGAFAAVYARSNLSARVQTIPRPAELNRRPPGTGRQRLFVGLVASLLIGLYALPLMALPLRSVFRVEANRGDVAQTSSGFTTDYYEELFINRQDSVFYVPPIRAAVNSVLYACATVVLSLLMGLPAATALARPGHLERLLDPLLILPLGASAVALGLGFILTFGRWLSSPFLVPLAHTLVALPFVIRTLQPAIATLPQRLRMAATTLGASPYRAWFAVDWPIIRRATLVSAGFAFTISLGEFGATSLLSRPEFPTIPVAIYRFFSQPGGLNYGQAMAMGTILMVLTTAAILVIDKLRLPGTTEF